MKHLLITIIAVFLESLVIADTIHNYAKDGDIVGLREQLDLGKDVSSEDELGWTPLHYAAFENQKTSAIFLINRGANLNAKAMENGFSFKRLHKYFDGSFMCEEIVTFNAEDYLKKNTGWTPLHVAASKGHLEIVKLLIGEGADPNLKDNEFYTPLHWACISQSVEMIKFFVNKHVDINENQGFHYTPLHLASVSGNKNIVEFLINHCAEINSKTFYGSTPLHGASMAGESKIVEVLLLIGADVNSIYRPSLTEIETPMDYVLRANVSQDLKKETVDLLLKHGGKLGKELKAEGFSLIP